MPRKLDVSSLIRNEAVERGIPYLLHFTQIQNLAGIIEHGLLPRTMLSERDDVTAWASGRHRLDGRNDAISVSISAVNARMFGAKKRESGHPHWVILLLDPCILWTHRCRFLRRSAASKEMLEHRGRLDGNRCLGPTL